MADRNCEFAPGKECRDCIYAADRTYDPACLRGHIKLVPVSGTNIVVWVDRHKLDAAFQTAREKVAAEIRRTTSKEVAAAILGGER